MRRIKLESACRFCVIAVTLLFVMASLGCDLDGLQDSNTMVSEDGPGFAASTGADEWVARRGEEEIGYAELDAPLRLELHDLALASYRLRRDRLNELVAERFGILVETAAAQNATDLQIHLRAPLAPRIDLPDGATALIGAQSAAVVVTHFIDFASPHSRRVQPDLIRLVDTYGERVRIETRLFPLPFHRNAREAAVAARCADSQNSYRAYHDVLLLEQPALDSVALGNYAERVGLDLDRFNDCLTTRAAGTEVDRDLGVAREVGVRRAATVFVNGIYLSGRPDFGTMKGVVEDELQRLGIDSQQGLAGEVGRPEEPARGSSAAGESTLPAIPPEALSEPGLIVELSRAKIDEALLDRQELNGRLDATRGEFSGHRLLKIRKVREGDLYSHLGLEAGDVLLALNGAFVTVDENRFFETLAKQDVVRLLVMRRGKPHSFEYRFR